MSSEGQLAKGIATIAKNLDRQVHRGKISVEGQDGGVEPHRNQHRLRHLRRRDLVIEAATENEAIKKRDLARSSARS